MTNRIWQSSDDEFIELIKNSMHIKEVLWKLGMTQVGNSWGYSQVKARMEAVGLTFADFKGKSAVVQYQIDTEIPNEKIFIEQKKHSRNIVRRRILRDNLIEYKCAICGISEWNGKKLSLELDHINGINYDNRLENLRFLCPNCHSQTTTYGSRNQQVNEPKYEISEELRDLVTKTYLKIKSQKAVAKALGIRRVIVNKIINEAGMNRSNQRYVIRYDKDRNEINRFGTINEAAKFLMDEGYLRTNLVKTARATFLRNVDSYWCDSYWKILDA